MNAELWTEKYRPETLDKVVGVDKNVENIIEWANQFVDDIPTRFKAVLLHGPEGVGKTTIAHAVSKDYGWNIVEVNASDNRTGEELKFRLSSAISSKSLVNPHRKHLILIDEVDSLHDTKESSAESVLYDFIISTKHPIIFTCNKVHKVPKKIRDECNEIQFRRLLPSTIRNALNYIAKAEGYNPSSELIESAIQAGDLRNSIMKLQAVLSTDVIIDAPKVVKHDPFTTVRGIFTATTPEEALDFARNSELNPEELILWIDQNLPNFYAGLEIYNASQLISRADTLLYAARKTREYGAYWTKATFLLSAGIMKCRMQPPASRHQEIESPSIIKKLGATKERRNLTKTVAKKVCPIFHCSSSSFTTELFPIIQKISLDNNEWLLKLSVHKNLNAEEIAFILDTTPNDPRIKRILNASISITEDMKKHIKAQESKTKSLLSFFKSPSST